MKGEINTMEINLSNETIEKICRVAKNNINKMESDLHIYELNKIPAIREALTEEKLKQRAKRVKEINNSINDSKEILELFEGFFKWLF